MWRNAIVACLCSAKATLHDTWLQGLARSRHQTVDSMSLGKSVSVALSISVYRQATRTQHATAVSGATGCQDIKMAFANCMSPA